MLKVNSYTELSAIQNTSFILRFGNHQIYLVKTSTGKNGKAIAEVKPGSSELEPQHA